MSAPAPARDRVLAQAKFDAVTLLRNGEQLLVSIVLPAIALVAGILSPYPDLGPHRIDTVVPGVLALSVISSAFTGQAITAAFDRRYGVLRLLGTTPLGRRGLLAARVLAVLVIEVIQFVALSALGLALGWRPQVDGLLPFLVFWLLGTVTFVAGALLLGGTLRAEATLALANLVWVLLLAGGGVVLPSDRFPAPWSTLVSLLPSAALGDGFRAALGGEGVSGAAINGVLALAPLGVLTVWAVVLGALASRLFRWSD